MSYATLADFKQFVGTRTNPPGAYERLTDRVAATTANDAVGQECLDFGEAQVNINLAKRYLTPIDVTGNATLATSMKFFTLALAVVQGYETHPRSEQLKDILKDKVKRILDLLDAICKGEKDLPGAVPIPTASGQSGVAFGQTQVFNESSMEGI